VLGDEPLQTGPFGKLPDRRQTGLPQIVGTRLR